MPWEGNKAFFLKREAENNNSRSEVDNKAYGPEPTPLREVWEQPSIGLEEGVSL
jgi:hypothetical protein